MVGNAREQCAVHFEEFIAKIPSNVGPEKQAFGQQNLHSPALTRPDQARHGGWSGAAPKGRLSLFHLSQHACAHIHTAFSKVHPPSQMRNICVARKEKMFLYVAFPGSKKRHIVQRLAQVGAWSRKHVTPSARSSQDT